MQTIIQNPTSLFSPAKAEHMAATLQADDEDWKYKVVHDPKGTGLSFIEIYDEVGVFIGKV